MAARRAWAISAVRRLPISGRGVQGEGAAGREEKGEGEEGGLLVAEKEWVRTAGREREKGKSEDCWRLIGCQGRRARG
jgi:hypothetical protein